MITRGQASRVAGYNLAHGDTLKPSAELMDIGDFEKQRLPFHATFWRSNFDGDGHLMEMCRHRNPLCTSELSVAPMDLFQCDLLHGFQLGPLQRWVTGSVWRIALHNPWGISGTKARKLEIIGQRLKTLLFQWYDEQKIPHEDRLFDFTLGMLGHVQDAQDDAEHAHKGCQASLKAAETGDIASFVAFLCNEVC